jgi:hypothetical protein
MQLKQAIQATDSELGRVLTLIGVQLVQGIDILRF